MRQVFILSLAFGLFIAKPASGCTFLIATGNAGVLVSTSPIGASLSEKNRELLVAIEQNLNREVSELLAKAPVLDNPWPMLRTLAARQNFFSERANEFWKHYDKERKTWSSAESKKQFLLFNSRALDDLQGILNVIEVISGLHRNHRANANRVVSFDSLSGAIIAKTHRQLVTQDESHFSKELYMRRVGASEERFEALFWEVELSPEQMESSLLAANASSDQLASNRVKYILVPGLHLKQAGSNDPKVYLDMKSRQLHFLMSLSSFIQLLQPVDLSVEGVPFRISSQQ